MKLESVNSVLVVFPQFLCLKNIRTFLTACCEVFGMKKSELFEAFDLFDVRDFGKVGQVSLAPEKGTEKGRLYASLRKKLLAINKHEGR